MVINDQAFICQPGHPLRYGEWKQIFRNDLNVSFRGTVERLLPLLLKSFFFRMDEVHLVKRVLKQDLQMSVVEIENNDEATIDGGDVLFTGQEIFVGLSQRTNYQGANALAKAFPEYPSKKEIFNWTNIQAKHLSLLFRPPSHTDSPADQRVSPEMCRFDGRS